MPTPGVLARPRAFCQLESSSASTPSEGIWYRSRLSVSQNSARTPCWTSFARSAWWSVRSPAASREPVACFGSIPSRSRKVRTASGRPESPLTYGSIERVTASPIVGPKRARPVCRVTSDRRIASSTSVELRPENPPTCCRSAIAPESPHGALSQLTGSTNTENSQLRVAAHISRIPSTPQSTGLTNATWSGSAGGLGEPTYWWWSRTITGWWWAG
jgi:hypothetical protein